MYSLVAYYSSPFQSLYQAPFFASEGAHLIITARTSGALEQLDDEIRILLSEKYIELYKILTGKEFQPSVGDVSDRIAKNLDSLDI